jgi:threonine synthase
MSCYIFAPSDIEQAKISQSLTYGAEFIGVEGTYDDANRLATQIADSKGIGIANVNMRPFYVEGSKTLAFEVAEQLSWTVPDHVVIPVASGAMLHSICQGFEELYDLGLLRDFSNLKVTAGQGRGCAPIVDAFKRNNEEIIPVEHPNTIAKSLAIGDPGDGLYALRKIKQYNGFAEDVTDREIMDAVVLLAKTEGIFTEPAGGVAVATLKKLVEDGKIERNESIVCYVTGNGLKATDALIDFIPKPKIVKPDIAQVSAIVR